LVGTVSRSPRPCPRGRESHQSSVPQDQPPSVLRSLTRERIPPSPNRARRGSGQRSWTIPALEEWSTSEPARGPGGRSRRYPHSRRGP
jgi:hypothetical protein